MQRGAQIRECPELEGKTALADMGQAGAKHVRERYLWDCILDRIHPELLEVVS